MKQTSQTSQAALQINFTSGTSDARRRWFARRWLQSCHRVAIPGYPILYRTYTEVPSTNFILTVHPDPIHCTCEPQERMFRPVRLVDRDFNRYVSPTNQSRAESLHTASIPRGGDVMYYSDGSDIQVTWPLGTTLSVCGDQIEEVE
jgi:hypothetical protein